MSALESIGFRRRGFAALAAEGIAARLKAMLCGIGRWREREASFRQLQALSDGQLKDIGLHRSHIPYLTGEISAWSVRRRHAAD